MNQPRRTRPNQRRKPQSARPAPPDIWRATGAVPDAEPIVVPPDPGIMLRSLGDPPVTGGTAAGHYFNAVVERAAAVAAALALSADLLAPPDDD